MSGPVFILAFVILSAFRDVFFADALRAAPFFAVALVAFATCTVAFLVVALIERERTLRVVFADLRTFVLMNLFTACAWLCYFQSLRYLEPAVANVLHAGLGPLTIMAMSAIGWRSRACSRRAWKRCRNRRRAWPRTYATSRPRSRSTAT